MILSGLATVNSIGLACAGTYSERFWVSPSIGCCGYTQL